MNDLIFMTKIKKLRNWHSTRETWFVGANNIKFQKVLVRLPFKLDKLDLFINLLFFQLPRFIISAYTAIQDRSKIYRLFSSLNFLNC